MAFGEEAPPDDAGSRWRRLSVTATPRLVTVMTTLEVRDGDVDSESVIATFRLSSSLWAGLIVSFGSLTLQRRLSIGRC